MKGTPAPRKELKRLERCGSVEAGIIIAIMSTALLFPETGLRRKLSDYIGTPAIVQGNAVWLADPQPSFRSRFN
jgi:hypothetical protein